MPYVTSEEHQECPARLQRLTGPAGALRSSEFSALEWSNGSGVTPATISDILRVHEHDYIQHLQVRGSDCRATITELVFLLRQQLEC
jgi:acetoin utilization deacetylase AcuC-like enzyme